VDITAQRASGYNPNPDDDGLEIDTKRVGASAAVLDRGQFAVGVVRLQNVSLDG
jgi:hypothetical protein